MGKKEKLQLAIFQLVISAIFISSFLRLLTKTDRNDKTALRLSIRIDLLFCIPESGSPCIHRSSIKGLPAYIVQRERAPRYGLTVTHGHARCFVCVRGYIWRNVWTPRASCPHRNDKGKKGRRSRCVFIRLGLYAFGREGM